MLKHVISKCNGKWVRLKGYFTAQADDLEDEERDQTPGRGCHCYTGYLYINVSYKIELL